MTLSIKTRSYAFYVLIALVSVQVLQVSAQTQGTRSLTVRDIMSEPSIAGMRPEGEKLSPNGKWVAYLWSAAGKDPRDLYLVSTSGGAPVILERAVDTPDEARPDKIESKDESRASEKKEERVMQRDAAQEARERSVTGIEWSADSRRLLFSKRGDLYILNVEETRPVARRITKTVLVEAGARWLEDSRRVLYQTGTNLFVVDLDQTSIVQLTREGGAAASRRTDESASPQQATTGSQSTSNVSVSGVQPSEDGAHVAYVVSDNSKQRALFVPNFTGEFVTSPIVRRGWTEQRVQIVRTDGTPEAATVVKLPAPEGVSYIRGVRWTPDSRALVIDRIDQDTKRRQLFYVNASDGVSSIVKGETDTKWIAPLSRIVEVSPNGKSLLYASERDGFNHLYLLGSLQLDKNSTEEFVLDVSLTRGSWEVNWAKWLPDGERVIYSSTEASTAERHFYILDVESKKPQRLSTPSGMNTDPQLSKDGKVLLFEHSEWNVPNDLFTLALPSRESELKGPNRLTDTVPAQFKKISWARPNFVEFKSKDGKTVKARVYAPPNFDKKRKYPAVVFVHGAGYLQNVINGWNNYYREAMFNHILTQRGYVILDIDYRGSAGYGREWRTDVHDFLGGLDFQDHLDGIDYVVENYSVDPTRVGMYGGSYGGFIAEMAVMRAPEKVACAAALRPVADWKNYYASSPVYTTERLGFPDKNPKAYERSSPITYVEGIKSPLLILHGMVDDNVHLQDSAQLVEKLIKLGKSEYFEVMFYPSENHAFTKPESWTDEYERILRFFERHLRRKGDDNGN
jgi:dipeptidyl aminopeptidase/acylaminoacyl peptidase